MIFFLVRKQGYILKIGVHVLQITMTLLKNIGKHFPYFHQVGSNWKHNNTCTLLNSYTAKQYNCTYITKVILLEDHNQLYDLQTAM